MVIRGRVNQCSVSARSCLVFEVQVNNRHAQAKFTVKQHHAESGEIKNGNRQLGLADRLRHFTPMSSQATAACTKRFHNASKTACPLMPTRAPVSTTLLRQRIHFPWTVTEIWSPQLATGNIVTLSHCCYEPPTCGPEALVSSLLSQRRFGIPCPNQGQKFELRCEPLTIRCARWPLPSALLRLQHRKGVREACLEETYAAFLQA